MTQPITVSAVVIRDHSGRVLTVRKRNTHLLMFPGGKPEVGESPVAAALREVSEELGVSLQESQLNLLGEFTHSAANEPGRQVQAIVYEHPYLQPGPPQAEIEHLEWVDPQVDNSELAPLLRYAVFPNIPELPRLTSIAVFTGSALGTSTKYQLAAESFARAAVARDLDLVYGGGKVGLMGVVADTALAAGGRVIGVIPESLVRGEIGHANLTSLEVVPNMHARKNRMTELADGFIALPGGAGTLEELFEVWTWQQLGIHTKPVALLDVAGFWQPLVKMVDQMTHEGFISSRFRDSLIVEADPELLLSKMATWRPPTPKWLAGATN